MWRYGLNTHQIARGAWANSWWREYIRLRLVVDQLPPEVTEPRAALKRVDHILALAHKRGDRSFTHVADGNRSGQQCRLFAMPWSRLATLTFTERCNTSSGGGCDMDQPADVMAAVAAATLGAWQAGVDKAEIQTMQGLMMHYYCNTTRAELWTEFADWVAQDHDQS